MGCGTGVKCTGNEASGHRGELRPLRCRATCPAWEEGFEQQEGGIDEKILGQVLGALHNQPSKQL